MCIYIIKKKHIWKTFKHLFLSVSFCAILFVLLHSQIQNTLSDKTMSHKIFVGQSFRHLRKISSLLPNEKFCPFSKFEISPKKTQFIYFFRDSPFLYHKNNKKSQILLFNNYAQLDLTVLNQRWFFFTFGLITSL